MYTIKKQYHFYAAHRNELIDDKCKNLHGHTYYIEVLLRFPPPEASGVTMLFSEIDDKICPIIKELDHTTLISENDPLKYFLANLNHAWPAFATSFKVLPFVTSAENIARYIFEQIADTKLDPVYVELRETTTSSVRYEL